MDGRIVAGRFIQKRAKGANGKVSTHLAEDPLNGERVVVKVFSEEEPLILEYVKGMNALNDHGCRGMALPLEGGMTEEEPGYYQAYPEIPGPTLDDFFALSPSVDAAEFERLVGELEEALRDLHRAGFVHLFLSPRNIFYSPGRPVITKDPALTYQHYSFFMQELAGFDYSFFSPRLMDGGEGRPEEDFYSLGRIVLHALDRVELAGGEPSRQALLERAAALMGGEGAGAGRGEAEARLIPAAGPCGEGEACSSRPAETAAGGACAAERESAGGLPEAGRAVREISLEGLPAGGCPAGAAGGGGRRRPRMGKRVVVPALMSACVLAGLAYGLQTRTEARTTPPSVGEAVLDGEGPPRAAGEALETAAPAAPESAGEAGFIAAGEDGREEPQPAAPAEAPGREPAEAPASAEEPAAGKAPAGNRRPVASFSASPCEGPSPLQVLLDASSSYDPDGTIVSYQWSCGGSGVAVFRVFESSVIPSRVSVTLTVTDGGGASASATRVITLY